MESQVSTHMPGNHPFPPYALKRSAKACDRCRKRRTKCLGNPPHPCVACTDVGHPCVYSESEKRVTVSESYLIELQAQARRAGPSREAYDRGAESDASSQGIELSFTGTDNWVLGNSGQYHFMGNSSSTYIANRLNPTAETLAWHKYPHYEDTSWLRRPICLDVPPLPPFDIACRLYRAQHAYIGTIFSFLTDSAFQERLKHVYSRVPDPDDQEECLIYCQVLLVFAFGQMYSINQWVGKEGPPGFGYFKHALALLPNVYGDGSILFIEVLSYAAYYMQTINRRDAAYLMIGVALRMAITLGLHQEVSERDIDSEMQEHRRRVWWSTYSMERLLCVASGHPISVQDEDIDLLLPIPRIGEDDHVATVLTAYTELSRIQGVIGEKIYRKKQKSGHDLSACVQHIMKRLSDWFDRLPEAVRLNPPDNAHQEPNRETVSTYLHYYHCINMTARPILLYVVQRKRPQENQQPDVAGWQDGLSPDIVHVIDTAISAARRSTSILSAAAKFNLVATYGFIDGEQAFAAALLLVMVNIAFPYKESDASAMNMALSVLQTMAERGNGYIRACYSLLTKIRSTIKLPEMMGQVSVNGQAVLDNQPHGEGIVGSTALVPTIPGEQNQAYSLNFEGDPALWAEVLESIDIDMDRQWIEMALRRGQHVETPDTP